jgi:GTPase SAR1 family protein
MAFALQHAQDRISKEKCSRTEVETPTVDIEELEIGSEEVFDEEVRTEHNIQDVLDVEAKKRYLQKVKLWKEIAREERMYVSYWDFAGQTTYYSTHQAFMAPSAVYVLVIDLTMDLDKHLEDTLKFRTKVLKQFTVEGNLFI